MVALLSLGVIGGVALVAARCLPAPEAATQGGFRVDHRSLPPGGSYVIRAPSYSGQLGQPVARPASTQAMAHVARGLPPPVPAVPVSSTLLGSLTSDDGSLQVSVGTYADCTGRLPLAASTAAIDTCATGRRYFVGHNPGVFTPLLHIQPGVVSAAATLTQSVTGLVLGP